MGRVIEYQTQSFNIEYKGEVSQSSLLKHNQLRVNVPYPD
jgi:hypothetical protein